jgi:protein phosphatase
MTDEAENSTNPVEAPLETTDADREDALDALASLACDVDAREVEAPDPTSLETPVPELGDAASIEALEALVADSEAAAQPADPADPAGAAAPAGLADPAPAAAPDAPLPTTADDPAATGEIDPLELAAMAAVESSPAQTLPFEPVAPAAPAAPPVSDRAGGAARGTGMLAWGACSDVGRVRDHNEDSFVIRFPLFAVADGMGGHAAGEVASTIAVGSLAQNAPDTPDDAALGAAVEEANRAVMEGAKNGVGRPGMGTTCTAVVIDGNVMAVGHVGDSRCYLLHAGQLARVTHDHSYVEELVAAGEITPEEARVHPNRSVITRALGNDPNMKADHFQVAVARGDRVLLCSDGLSSMVTDDLIEETLVSTTSPQTAADALVDLACAAGGHDNVTCLVVDVKDDGIARHALRQRLRNVGLSLLVTLAVLGGLAGVLSAVASHSWYLAAENGYVCLFQGIPGLPGALFTDLLETSSVRTSALSEAVEQRLKTGITFSSEDEARAVLEEYRAQAAPTKEA